MSEGASKKGIIFVFLSAVFFSLAGILMKINTMSSLTMNGLRCGLAFFVMYAYMRKVKHKFRFNMVVLLGAFVTFGMSLTFSMANKMTTAANAIVLQFCMPAFVILLLWIFWKQKPDKIAVASVIMSFAGIIFFFLDSLSEGGMAGNLIAVFSGFLYAVVILIKKIPKSDFESSVLLSHLISFVVGIPAVVQEPSWTPTNIVTIIVLGIVQTGLSMVCLNVGLNYVQPVAASLISMIEPILNPILVAVFYGETMGVISIFGAIIVLGSALFYNLMKSKET